jgi:hypothetical protein
MLSFGVCILLLARHLLSLFLVYLGHENPFRVTEFLTQQRYRAQLYRSPWPHQPHEIVTEHVKRSHSTFDVRFREINFKVAIKLFILEQQQQHRFFTFLAFVTLSVTC